MHTMVKKPEHKSVLVYESGRFKGLHVLFIHH